MTSPGTLVRPHRPTAVQLSVLRQDLCERVQCAPAQGATPSQGTGRGGGFRQERGDPGKAPKSAVAGGDQGDHLRQVWVSEDTSRIQLNRVVQ